MIGGGIVNSDRFGRLLCYILRHNPAYVGTEIDKNGWIDVKELIRGLSERGINIDFEYLENIVKNDKKSRYSFDSERRRIRANQGHSIDVNIEFEERMPPDKLYHGTATRFLPQIKEQGI